MEPSELKVVLTLKENRALIGVIAPDCDPHLPPGLTLESEGLAERVQEALGHVGGVLRDAMALWDERKRNPRYVKPKAAAAAKGKGPQPVATTAQATQPRAVAEESLTRTPELPLLEGRAEQAEASPQEAAERPQEPPGDAPEEPEAPTQEEGPQEPPAAPEEPEVPVAPTGQEPGPQEAPAEEPVASTAQAPARSDRGGWVYYVSGAGPFHTVHAALLAHGVSQAEIDAHKWWHRWDRLPKKYQDAIEKRKAS